MSQVKVKPFHRVFVRHYLPSLKITHSLSVFNGMEILQELLQNFQCCLHQKQQSFVLNLPCLQRFTWDKIMVYLIFVCFGLYGCWYVTVHDVCDKWSLFTVTLQWTNRPSDARKWDGSWSGDDVGIRASPLLQRRCVQPDRIWDILLVSDSRQSLSTIIFTRIYIFSTSHVSKFQQNTINICRCFHWLVWST